MCRPQWSWDLSIREVSSFQGDTYRIRVLIQRVVYICTPNHFEEILIPHFPPASVTTDSEGSEGSEDSSGSEKNETIIIKPLRSISMSPEVSENLSLTVN